MVPRRRASWTSPAIQNRRERVDLAGALKKLQRGRVLDPIVGADCDGRFPASPLRQVRAIVLDACVIRDDVLRSCRARFKAAALPAIPLHGLRHSYATLALSSGVNPGIVSARLGHATVALTLDVYSHVLPQADRDAAEAIADLLPVSWQRPSSLSLDGAAQVRPLTLTAWATWIAQAASLGNIPRVLSVQQQGG